MGNNYRTPETGKLASHPLDSGDATDALVNEWVNLGNQLIAECNEGGIFKAEPDKLLGLPAVKVTRITPNRSLPYACLKISVDAQTKVFFVWTFTAANQQASASAPTLKKIQLVGGAFVHPDGNPLAVILGAIGKII